MAAEKVIRDQYDDMTGPVLVAELGKRELNVSGKVEELRDRLRAHDAEQAQKAADGPDDTPEGDETDADSTEVLEPRAPVDYSPMAVVLTEGQARQLNAGETSIKRHFRYITSLAPRKYGAGDRVTGIADWENRVCRVLPFGVEIVLNVDQQNED